MVLNGQNAAQNADNIEDFTARLDARLNLRLAQLELLPGSISGKGLERTSAGVERGIPVDTRGRGRGDLSVYVFRKRIKNARSITARFEVLRDLEEAIRVVKESRKQGWFDLGTAEGRRAAGRMAVVHGTAYASRSLGVPDRTMRRYKAEYLKAC